MFRNMLVGLAIAVLSLSSSALVEHKDGSVTLSAPELKALSENVNAVVQQAYTAGVKDGVEAAKSNPKICPKDI